MNSENSYLVVKTLDNSPRFLFWTLDEFSIFCVPLLIGIGIGSVLIALSGIPLKYFYSKAKRKFPKGALMHQMYWNVPKIFFKHARVLQNTPESHKREFLL
jgi:conjugal transfer pilus assembly protein TraL